MIYDELRYYISQVASPETISFFDKGIEIFDKYDVPNYMDTFDTTIGENSERCDQDILDQLTATLRSGLDYLLNLQGVVLIDDTLPSMVNAFAEGIYDLDNYEDQDSVLAILESDQGTTAEKLCEILGFVTPFQVEELLPLIETVEDGFVSGYKDRMVQRQEELNDMATSVTKQIQAYVKFKNHMLNAPIYADKFFTQLGSIGMPYEEYVKVYLKDNNDNLAHREPSGVAAELVSLTCLSSDGVDTPLLTAKKYLSMLYSDINAITKVDMAITSFVIGMHNVKT